MERAFGRIQATLDALRLIPEVKTCDAVTGQFDVIAQVEGVDVNAIGRTSYARIQMIDGVLRIITCQVIKLD